MNKKAIDDALTEPTEEENKVADEYCERSKSIMGKRYADDSKIMQRVIKEKLGLDVTEDTCFSFWATYSEEYYCAGWLCIRDLDEIVKAFKICGPPGNIKDIVSSISCLETQFRRPLLDKIQETFCFGCGEDRTNCQCEEK